LPGFFLSHKLPFLKHYEGTMPLASRSVYAC
jgi:hypothetical protein